jgi:hypothetical protein
MPNYTSASDNQTYTINDWPGVSYKAAVINQAYATGQFAVVNLFGTATILFRCFWCKRYITSAGVQGDHVVAQQLGRSDNAVLQDLFQEAEENGDNLVLSCSECNGGTRNQNGMKLRSHYAKDRAAQGPQ